MKKSIVRTAILSIANLCLLTTLFVACQKEPPPVVHQGVNAMLQQYDLPSDVHYMLSQDEETTGAEDRDGMKIYPYSDGSCRVIFKVRNFNPQIPHGGGDGPPCSHSSILFRGYSQPNGQGTLLFSIGMQITGDWQEFLIPSNAYILFVIQEDLIVSDGPCRFKFLIADYGWNRNVLTWINIPYGQWLPVLTGRFAPKDPATDGSYNIYDEYICDTWCTWTAPVSFENNDPFPDPWISASLRCFYGSNALPVGGIWPDPRVIKDYPLFDNYNKVLLFYPIMTDANHSYRTEAADIGPADIYDIITYNVFGPNQQGVGPFVGWGVSPYSFGTTGRSCNVLPNG